MNAPMTKAEPKAASETKILTMDDGVKLPDLDAVIAETEKIGAILPRSIDEAYRLAQAIVKSGLAPDSYKRKNASDADPQMVMIGILKAMEVGLPPITGLGVIAVINGKPSIWGAGAVALIQSRGVLKSMEIREIGTIPREAEEGEFTKTNTFVDSFGVEVIMERVGQSKPYVGRFTVGDAKRAKLWMNTSKPPWMLYPRRMLKWRAFSIAADDGFSDCLSGLTIREIAEDLPAAPTTVDSSFLDDAPQDEAPPHSDEPEAPVPDTGESAAAPESAAEPATEADQGEGQGDLLGGPPSTEQLVAAVRAALSDDDLTAYLKSMREQIDAMDKEDQVVINDAVEAQRVKLSEGAPA